MRRLQGGPRASGAIKTAPAAGPRERDMSALRRSWGRGLAISAMLLAACGGGGGSGGTVGAGGSLALNPTSLTFTADHHGPVPASKNILATFTEPTVALLAVGVPAGSAVPPWLTFNITGKTSPITITVAANTTEMTPGTLSASVSGASLQPGTYQATIQISGNGRTVNVPVTYVRRAPQVSFVAPYVGLTNTAGQAIIRGSGFNAITTQKVKFGTTDAVSQTVNNDTQITASYPALPEGTYPVFVENSTGAQ